MDFKRLLVIIDPTREEQPALTRARVIARQLGSRIQLYACIHEDVAAARQFGSSRQQALDACHAWMESLARPLREAGLDVTVELEWGSDWYQACLNAAQRDRADVVLKSSFKRPLHQRILKRTSDWTLIRQCKSPVLLVKDGGSINPRGVLAAVDPHASEGSRAQANEKILEFSRRLIESDSAEVHFVGAYPDLSQAPDRNQLARDWGVDAASIHVRVGDPDDVIVGMAEQLGVGLLVIGNAGRSGLAAVVRNNTVERVLDKLDCDLLAVS